MDYEKIVNDLIKKSEKKYWFSTKTIIFKEWDYTLESSFLYLSWILKYKNKAIVSYKSLPIGWWAKGVPHKIFIFPIK